MEKTDVLSFQSDELSREKLDELIDLRKSFKVFGVNNIAFTVNKIEGAIEKKKLSCRVYSEMRSVAITAGILNPFTIVGGVVAATGTAIHNIATFNPDYEIGKNYIKSTVTVTYKKE